VLLVHLFSAIASDILLMLTAVTSLLYLRQDYFLKHRKRIISLPSIQSIDTLSLRLLISAFVLMTFGILAGSVLAYQEWGGRWYLDPRQIWSMVNWVVFAFVLLARFWVGWRGRSAVLITLTGVTLVMIGFFALHYFNWSQHYAL
jgi:ABC-type uncharacterized transport system permease subunit